MRSQAALQRHHAVISGQGDTTLVFVHGFGCDRNIWRFVAPAFEAQHRTLVYDHAGCGDALAAWDVQHHASLKGYAADLLAVLDAAGLERVICVAHSVGGVIALLAAEQQPQRFEHLLMLAPSPRFINDPPDYVGGFEREDLDEMFHLMESNHFGWARFLAPMAIGEANPQELVQQFETALCALEPRIARHFARLAFLVEARALVGRARVPATIVQSLHDSVAPPEVGRWMHRHMPLSRLREVDISGHCPHVSHPALTMQLIQEVLDARTAAGA
ncbi:alpha/beta fold hydrolase [Roseateles sp. DC23W]|uniref:Alpha/beta fold hydrolase n=1 Tax=Pelomonas dachongensis TaxID=3299029 RepID=A0ABW7EKX2_9BURK